MLLWFGKGKSHGLHGRAGIHIQRPLKHSSTLLNIHMSQFILHPHIFSHAREVYSDIASQSEYFVSGRRELFCKKNKSLENLPPTQDALLQHARRAVFQTNIWTTSLQNIQDIPTPEDWGWRKQENSWKPIWMTLPEAASTCNELIRCGCKSTRGCST